MIIWIFQNVCSYMYTNLLHLYTKSLLIYSVSNKSISSLMLSRIEEHQRGVEATELSSMNFDVCFICNNSKTIIAVAGNTSIVTLRKRFQDVRNVFPQYNFNAGIMNNRWADHLRLLLLYPYLGEKRPVTNRILNNVCSYTY
jgi:hypothetical protein